MTSRLAASIAVTLALTSCAVTATPVVADAGAADTRAPSDAPTMPRTCSRDRDVDLLFVIDNSYAMDARQGVLARSIGAFVEALIAPPVDPATGRAVHPAARTPRVGAITTDLGTPGTTVISCANSDIGDDGRLNPIRYGQALRGHQPWRSDYERPARCAANDPNQYPRFLTFDAASSSVDDLSEDFLCYAYFPGGAGGWGCSLGQQLEATYRALVVHDARDVAGNTRPNAGFLRDDAVLGIVMLTDTEDASVRDCRYANPGTACTDGIGAFDVTSAAWASPSLGLRFYLYEPGGPQDPTWPLDRYLDPMRPLRGFTAVKPGAPQLVVFGAITGVPLSLPLGADGNVDWTTLLGSRPDGSDGYVGDSPEGPVSMRQGNIDPECPSRVVPSCRRPRGTFDPSGPACRSSQQYFALPSRRIAEVVRRFDATYQNGVLGSICQDDYTATLRAIARRIGSRFCP